MANDPFWAHVEEVLHIVKQHSERHKRPQQATTTVERLSGWACLAGGVIFAGAEVLRQAGDPKTPFLLMAYVSLSILGLVIFMAGAMTGVVETVRKARRPFVEHVDRVVEALSREYELIDALERFEAVTGNCAQAATTRIDESDFQIGSDRRGRGT